MFPKSKIIYCQRQSTKRRHSFSFDLDDGSIIRFGPILDIWKNNKLLFFLFCQQLLKKKNYNLTIFLFFFYILTLNYFFLLKHTKRERIKNELCLIIITITSKHETVTIQTIDLVKSEDSEIQLTYDKKKKKKVTYKRFGHSSAFCLPNKYLISKLKFFVHLIIRNLISTYYIQDTLKRKKKIIETF